MKMKLILPVLLLTAVSCLGASLAWDPSPTAADTPPAMSYRVYSSSVQSNNWVLYGSTTNLTYPVMNNVYRKFHVVGVSEFGLESLPSNVVTNNFALPPPPGRLTVTNTLQTAQNLEGPWMSETSVVMTITLPSSNTWFRGLVTYSTGPSLERSTPAVPTR